MPIKKILIVTRNFPPLVGGMEKLNLHICQALAKIYNVSVAGPKDSSKFHEQMHFVEFSSAPLWRYILSSWIKTAFLALKNKPNLVFCGSGAAILAGFFAAKITRAKLVCYLHGLDIIVDSIIYQNLFVPLIKKSDLILVNSNHSKSLAIKAGIDNVKIKILAPGTDLPSLENKHVLSQSFKRKHQLDDKKVLLIVGRLNRRKGIAEFIEYAMPKIVEKTPNIRLVIIGEEASQAIKYQAGIKDEILDKINSLKLQQYVLLLGGVSDEELTSAFFSAELLVFPVLDMPNDVEGFGMVAIEAAAHGLPTLGFAVGGVPDAVGHEESGWLIPSGEYENMEQKINKLLDSDSDSCAGLTKEKIINYAKQFEWSRFEEKLKNILVRDF